MATLRSEAQLYVLAVHAARDDGHIGTVTFRIAIYGSDRRDPAIVDDVLSATLNVNIQIEQNYYLL